jgi:ribosomal protein S13
MLYILGARLLPDEQVRIALTKMDGIGPKKSHSALLSIRYQWEHQDE